MFPFGEKCQNNGLVSVENPYLYGGKELQTFFGIDWYDSGARFQTLHGTFSSLDPMAESYYPVSPYAYCAGDPVNYVDSEGEKKIFVNGYLIKKERNQQGEQYWRDSFVQGAQSFFKDYSVYFTNIDYWFGSSSSSRRKLGYYYAKENYASLFDGVSESDSFNLVSHSMGGAFSMGIKDYLEEQGWSVKSSIFINAYQSDKI